MPYTELYQFEKPGIDDFYNIDRMNINWDKAEAALKSNSLATAAKASQADLTALSNTVASHSADTTNLKIISGNYNGSSVFIEGLEDTSGKFPVVFVYRNDGKLLTKSILSGGTTPLYIIRSETIYKTDGVTIDKTSIYDRYYSANGKLFKEVIRI